MEQSPKVRLKKLKKIGGFSPIKTHRTGMQEDLDRLVRLTALIPLTPVVRYAVRKDRPSAVERT
jgi:hypothetical protein